MLTIEQIKQQYPLHLMVWNDEPEQLREALNQENKFDVEKRDPRGRTPVMLAVRLCHLECVKILVTRAKTNIESDGWSLVQEAVCTGNPDILRAVMEVRDLQRHLQRTTHVPLLLQRLHDAPDFYVEMKWEFTTWVPLMSRLCPSDTYRVYKRGSNVRIDTTLLGFDHASWQRGRRSYIFKGQMDTAVMIEVNHDTREATVDTMQEIQEPIESITTPPELLYYRLTAPVTSNTVDMDKISFERNKSGIWGWRSEKNEPVNGYECKVYSATNVEFITRTRTEHLAELPAKTKKPGGMPLQSLFGVSEEGAERGLEQITIDENGMNVPPIPPPPEFTPDFVSPEEYFSDMDLGEKDVGRPKRQTKKVQNFKANLWLSEDFPIKLQEQVIPILDLMSSIMSPHVSKLKDFITMQLPAGFPVKVEIPLFHVINACVTFGNVFALETPVPNVTHIEEGDRLTCVVDDRCFHIPPDYEKHGGEYLRSRGQDEDDLLQYAIQQSLIDAGSENDQVDIWEALRAQRPLTPGALSDEDSQLQRRKSPARRF
ncbi:ankyrin repeat domain-containing protein 13D isoform X2 [Phlebotomus argentipes]|uniref:ankyrin repeat domain-containing protein 13D isoform X2 n=1 Tax=Phlebotomus argentipes TaxID=94469 RepID=UPI002892C4D4|nr:ankyrin repeat domain-containing protein 13D isoform X2 [Phlebotomus argentipes]